LEKRPNLLDPGIRSNPYPLYAELRRDRPVCQVDPGGAWAVSRYGDVQRVLRDPKTFSSAGFGALLRPPWLGWNPIADSVLARDPPDHTRLRALVSRAFIPSSIARLEGRIAAHAAEMADRLLALGEADFVAEMAGPLPARIISEMIGVDPSRHGEFKRWCDVMSAITPAPPASAIADQIRGRLRAMERYFRGVLADRRRAPREDIVTDLVRAEVDGERLSDNDLLAMLFLLLPAGMETSVNLLSKLMMVLAERPEEFARIRADRARIPAVVEEGLRFEAPLHSIPRLATADVELAGVTVPAGAMVIALLGSANRDETEFPDPDRFDPDRGGQGALAFGHGIHFCFGAALARLQARLLLEAIAARFRGIERLPGELSWNPALVVHGPVALPLRLIPA
jgi:cytochrome P450